MSLLTKNEELTAKILLKRILRRVLMRKEKRKVKFRCDVNLNSVAFRALVGLIELSDLAGSNLLQYHSLYIVVLHNYMSANASAAYLFSSLTSSMQIVPPQFLRANPLRTAFGRS